MPEFNNIMAEILIEYIQHTNNSPASTLRSSGGAIKNIGGIRNTDLLHITIGVEAWPNHVWVEPNKITVTGRLWFYDLHDPNFVPEDLCKEILEHLIADHRRLRYHCRKREVKMTIRQALKNRKSQFKP